MADRFFRNQNQSERTSRLNSLAECIDDVEGRVEDLEAQTGGAPPPSYDPGDLTVYYENGKA